MNELRLHWIAALRSGVYEQTNDRLRKGDRLDALGVLCHIYDPTRWNTRGAAGWHYDNEDHYLPGDVAEAAGLSRGWQDCITEMGDCQNMSFARIADELEGLNFDKL